MKRKKNRLYDLERYRVHFLLIGLALSLGIVLWLFNINFLKDQPEIHEITYQLDYPDAEIPITVREEPKKVSAPLKVPDQIQLIEDVKEVDDEFEFDATEVDPDEAVTDKKYVVGNEEVGGEVLTISYEEEEDIPMNFAVVERVPVFPGCEKAKDNKERRECFQAKILAYAAENYNYTERARQLKLRGRVFVKFVIEKDGWVSHVEIARGIDPLVDDEAIRVVKSLPRMKPAQQRGKAVRMSFILPIKLVLE